MSDEENKEGRKVAENVHIEVDTANTERLARENEKLRSEKEANQKKSLAERKLELFSKFHNENFLHAQTDEELRQMFENHINEVEHKGKGTPSGSAPLNDKQFGAKVDDLYSHKFSSYPEMISTLREKIRSGGSGSREAQSYLDMLMEQAARKMRSTEQPIPIPSRNDVENLPALKDFHGYKVPVHREQGDLGALMERWANLDARRKRAKEQLEAGANPQRGET